MYTFSHISKFLRVSFMSAVLFLSISKGNAEDFPRELQDFAKKLNCTPRKDAPFKWGAIKGIPVRDSAVFWCATKKDTEWGKSFASLTIYVRPGAKVAHPCPSTIAKQDVFDELDVWEPGTASHKKITLDTLYFVDTNKAGKKTETTKGLIFDASTDHHSAAILYYCNNGRWMARSSD